MVFQDLRKLSRLFKDQLIYPLIAAAREGKAWMFYHNWKPDWQYGGMPPLVATGGTVAKNSPRALKSIFLPNQTAVQKSNKKIVFYISSMLLWLVLIG